MFDKLKHHWNVTNRREFFTQAGSGLAGHRPGRHAAIRTDTPRHRVIRWRPRSRTSTPKRQVHHLVFHGRRAPATWICSIPSPRWRSMPVSRCRRRTIPKHCRALWAPRHNGLYPTRHTFKQYGESGLWVSDWLPNIAEHMDDIAVLRSCTADGVNHVGAVCQMNTGEILAGRPSHGRLGDLRSG